MGFKIPITKRLLTYQTCGMQEYSNTRIIKKKKKLKCKKKKKSMQY